MYCGVPVMVLAESRELCSIFETPKSLNFTMPSPSSRIFWRSQANSKQLMSLVFPAKCQSQQ
jgi:hypothetical protein